MYMIMFVLDNPDQFDKVLEAWLEAADRNIEERLDDLEQRYHQVRQHSIMSKPLDIVASAGAAIG